MVLARAQGRDLPRSLWSLTVYLYPSVIRARRVAARVLCAAEQHPVPLGEFKLARPLQSRLPRRYHH